jgi:hypothetical protein
MNMGPKRQGGGRVPSGPIVGLILGLTVQKEQAMAKNRVGNEDHFTKQERVGTKCPLTLEQFQQKARALLVQVGTEKLLANVKVFSTGSFGYNASGKITLDLEGTPVQFQVGLNVIAVGSKG